MPVNIKVIHMKYFLGTAVTEVLNFAVSKRVLYIAAQMEQPGEYEIWVDSRESDTVVSIVDTDQVDEMLAVHPPLRQSKMTLITSMNDARQAGSLEPLPWLGDPRAVAAAIPIK